MRTWGGGVSRRFGESEARRQLVPQSSAHNGCVSSPVSYTHLYDQDAIVKLVLSLREQKKTFCEIGAELTLRGFTPQRGGRWFPAQVKAILDLNQPGRTSSA